MSLVGFGVKNLRCLTDTGIVPLKPITLLVGRNSSGKSTFLRAFPLLRQSVENARSSPILWEHPDYVDFGNIDLALNSRAAERCVTFEFGVELAEEEEPCQLNMKIASSPDGAYLDAYELHIAGADGKLHFDPTHQLDSYRFHDVPVPMDGYWLGEAGCLIAPIDTEARGRLIYQSYVEATSPLRRRGGRGVMQRRSSFPRQRGFGVARGARAPWRPDEIAKNLSALDLDIAYFMYCVAYLGPQRAVAARLYRLRDVAVEEVRSNGENLANFLASLSQAEMASFAVFTGKHLGFEPSARVDKLSVEILIEESKADLPRNIADVGFGYAEVLPLCAALWSSCIREPSAKRRQTSLLALEQPELHLHPAHQARLADMIVGALHESREWGREVKLMIETHSEALVNGLGDLIEAQVLPPEDVQIVIFDQDPETRQTQLRFAHYDEDGALRDWPFGFFAPVARNPFAVAANG